MGCRRARLTATFLAGSFFLSRLLRGLFRRFLLGWHGLLPGGWFLSFFCRLLGRFLLGWSFLDGRLLCGRLLGRSFLSRSFLLGRCTRTAPAARWRGGRRYSGRLTGHRYGDLVVLFLYQNGFLFLFFLFLQILFQRFAEGAAVTVFIRLIVPTVESRIIEAHISS